MTLDYSTFDALTFDCYGTLIDWEAGILAALKPMLPSDAGTNDEELLVEYANVEATLEAGPYLSYRELLGHGLAVVARAHEGDPGEAAIERAGGSVVDWPAFPDSADALARLAARYGLGVITNCDDDLFAASSRRLGDPFRWVITAQQVRSYKPAARNFEIALERIGVPRERVLHVAQSLYHDHVTAHQLGLATAWVNRRAGREGGGATPAAIATPDLEVPNMASLADLAGV